MTSGVYIKTYEEPPFDTREISRYAGALKNDDGIFQLIDECVELCRECFSYSVCYSVFDVETKDGTVDFGFSSVKSSSLAKTLSKSKEAIIFASTVGIGIDRYISKYSRLSPAKALIFQAIGTERAEALCDAFCKDIGDSYLSRGCLTTTRFSPGYGDLPLEFQREIFRVLAPFRQIGLSLNESLIMSPSKSVSAIIGVETKNEDRK